MEKHSPTNPTFQKRNWCLTTAITLFLVLTFYGISIPQTIRTIMSTPYDVPIKVTISATPPSTPLALNVVLENTSKNNPIYLLKWSTPLDSHAAAIGVFTFTSAETGEKAPGIGLIINRRLPVSGYFSVDDEDIVRIEAGGKLESVVEVKDHEVSLKKGKSYRVQATGRWMGAWIGEHEKLGFEEGSDSLIGEFESEGIEIDIPE